jgi:putative protease
VFVGDITKYYPRLGVAELLVRAGPLKVGDALWIIGETTGALRTQVTGIRVGDEGVSATQAEKGLIAAIPVPGKVRTGGQGLPNHLTTQGRQGFEAFAKSGPLSCSAA